MASLSTCHLGLWLGWQILLNAVCPGPDLPSTCVHRFYIILRGQVSVLHKDAFEDVDLGDEGQAKKVDRGTLGSCLVVLGE